MSGATTNCSTYPAAYAHTHASTNAQPTANGDANTRAPANADPGAQFGTHCCAYAISHFGTHCCAYAVSYAVSSVHAGALVRQSISGANGACGGRPLPKVQSRPLEPWRLCSVPRLPARHVRQTRCRVCPL